MRSPHLFVIAILCALPLAAQNTPKKSVPANTAAHMQQMILPSNGSMLLGVFYLAAGTDPHPTAIILHGFPGFEQNLDLAQALRARGWNVLAMHYRGSWGVKGDFSFQHAAEDADTEVRFLLEPANAQKYHVDTHRVIVIGHSMGGYMAASAAAHNPQLGGAVLVSAWNIGADYESPRRTGSVNPSIESEAKSLAADNNLLPLSGTSGEALAREIYEHKQGLNILGLTSAIAPRPVLIVTSNDGLAPADHAIVEALGKAGDTRVTEQHWDTDHSYSDRRSDLASAILEWAQANLPR